MDVTESLDFRQKNGPIRIMSQKEYGGQDGEITGGK